MVKRIAIVTVALWIVAASLLARDPVPGRGVMETGTNVIGGVKIFTNGVVNFTGTTVLGLNTGTDTNTVNNLIASGTSLNASNWLGWASASNTIWSTFLTTNAAALAYYPLNGNPSGFLTNNQQNVTLARMRFVTDGYAESDIIGAGDMRLGLTNYAYTAIHLTTSGYSLVGTDGTVAVRWDSGTLVGTLSGTSTVAQTALAGWPTTWPQYAGTGTVITVTCNGNSGTVTVGNGGTITLGSDASKLATNGISIVQTTNSAGVASVSGGEISIGTNLPPAAAAAAGGVSQVALGNAAFVIGAGSTASRVGVDFDMTQVVTNDTLRRRAYFIGDVWSTNQQVAVESAAFSGTVTGSVLVLLNPSVGTTNWPTSFGATGTVTVISGQLDWATLNVTNGIYDIELRCNSVSGRTNLLKNLLRRQAQ